MAYAQPKKTALEDGAAGAASVLDQRKEERYSTTGSVRLILDQDGGEAVEGRLVDVSTSGFRAMHGSQELNPGRVIRFDYEASEFGMRKSGWARVIWSRVQNEMVESGCYVVIAD
jgi:hypothetical protein